MGGYRAGERGDHLFNHALLPAPPYRDAAVLIPILKHQDSYSILFTQRTAHLQSHAGQVSFPGGRVDTADADAVATALRETAEEIGLAPENVTVLGMLDYYITRTGYRVTPVVGLVERQEWLPADFEVAEIFEVPLDYILTPNMLAKERAVKFGEEREFYALTWEKHYIWGATAGILRNFLDVIADDEA